LVWPAVLARAAYRPVPHITQPTPSSHSTPLPPSPLRPTPTPTHPPTHTPTHPPTPTHPRQALLTGCHRHGLGPTQQRLLHLTRRGQLQSCHQVHQLRHLGALGGIGRQGQGGDAGRGGSGAVAGVVGEQQDGLGGDALLVPVGNRARKGLSPCPKLGQVLIVCYICCLACCLACPKHTLPPAPCRYLLMYSPFTLPSPPLPSQLNCRLAPPLLTTWPQCVWRGHYGRWGSPRPPL
jgi:hypothetical protein